MHPICTCMLKCTSSSSLKHGCRHRICITLHLLQQLHVYVCAKCNMQGLQCLQSFIYSSHVVPALVLGFAGLYIYIACSKLATLKAHSDSPTTHTCTYPHC